MASFSRPLEVKITNDVIPAVCNKNNLLFDIYYNYPSTNLADKNPISAGKATGITYTQLTNPLGYIINVPPSATTIWMSSNCGCCPKFIQNISCSINVAFANDTGSVCNTTPTLRYTTPNGKDTSSNNNTAPGTIFYSDIRLQTPITGFSYARLVDSVPFPPVSYVYLLNSSNGQVLSSIGQTC